MMVIRPEVEGGEAWDFGEMVVYGEVRDEKDEVKVADIGCTVRSDGKIELLFPALEEGDYIFVVEGSGKSGDFTCLMEGYLGVRKAKAIQMDKQWGDGEVLAVKINGQQRRAVWDWSSKGEQSWEQVQNGVEEVNKGVQIVQGFIALFENKFSSAVYVDPNTGHLIIGGKDSGVKVPGDAGKSPYVDALGHWRYWDDAAAVWKDGGLAKGADGADGRSVRRILVESYADIPQSGDTCNGGHLYYVPYKATRFVANKSEKVKIKLSGVYNGPDGSDLVLNGHQVMILSYGELWKEELLCSVNQMHSKYSGVDYTLYAGTYDVAFAWSAKLLDNDTLELTAKQDGAEVEIYANSKHFELAAGVYHIYAWLEPDGWVRVDERQDLASTDTYGLIKYGTDAVIMDGTPVGKNDAGQATVPTATQAYAGTVKVAGEYPDGGAYVYMDANGQLVMPYGHGAVIFKMANPTERDVADVVREIDAGQAGVFVASTEGYGVVTLASSAADDADKAVTVQVMNDAMLEFSNNILNSYRLVEDSYSKSEVYSKQEVYTQAEVDELVNQARAEGDTCVKQGMGDCKVINVVSFAEFDSLVRDPEQIYFVKR